VRAGVFAEAARDVTKLPWEYLFDAFEKKAFPDIFDATWIASLILLIVLVILYNVRTRQLHAHRPFLDLYEWLLWTGLATFGLLLIMCLFKFSFILVLATIVTGLGTLVWIRFLKFPPELRAYEQRLARQRYLSRQRMTRPEATVRQKPSRRRRRR
jgi:hypothetical protein